MHKLNDKQLAAEVNSLALYFSNRELHPDTVTALCAAAAGEIIGRNRAAGILDDSTTERMLQSCFNQMRYVAYAGDDKRN